MRLPRILIAVLCFLSFRCSEAQDRGVLLRVTAPSQAAQSAQNLPAQAAPSAQSAPATAPAADHRIWLDVVVTDKSGNPIPGLQQADFKILDSKQPTNILSFSATDPNSRAANSLQVIFLVDAVNTGAQSMSYERDQLEKFLREDGGKLELPTSLVLFTDTATQVQPASTRDGNALADLLKSNPSGLRISGRSQGFYGAEDRLALSLRTLEQLTTYESKQPGRKLLIWISPGWPLLSGPTVMLSEKNQEWLFRRVVSFSNALREARITLYSVDPLGLADAVGGRTFYYQTFLKGVPSANRVQSGNLALQVLATQSGGRVLNTSNEITRLISSVLIDARAYYSLSFDAPPADRADEYHNLEVRVDKPGLVARTRTGYYAQPYKSTGRGN
jgi:VWFA-related protein